MRALIPEPLLAVYHFALALLGAVWYRFPSRQLTVIGVTGTKGKSSTVEIIRAILTEAGYTVASTGTIQFCIGDRCERNLFKMTMPGRFFLQRFLRQAVNEGATHAVIEMTSEGARQHRHRSIELDALVFLNLAPEHIERHGSMEAYVAAKLSLAEHVARSHKRPRIIVANIDDPYGDRFLAQKVELPRPFSLRDAEPYTADERSVRFVWNGDLYSAPLAGVFNLANILAALTLSDTLGVPRPIMKKALEHMPPIAGRVERIEQGQPFQVVVDYAHTPDSLKALYDTFKDHRIIAVLGSTGGGRDRWKRREMGALASARADVAFLTNEDPYDEDPRAIVDDIAQGFSGKAPHVVLDRREAIVQALIAARPGDAVLITGKGTDPVICGPNGTKEPWSDARAVREALSKLGYH